jgi:[histone H3]-N6,N6-dimethyl-L-lysine4 FAD-dependent demethylase
VFKKCGSDFHFVYLSAGIFQPKGINVPDPIQSICTRWGSDPFSYGSYSHVSVQSSGEDYDILAENVGNRLFFAGEATSRQYPATMHGAFMSGLREASRIYHLTGVQQPCPKKSMSKNTGPNSSILVNLFKRPNLQFGNFAFICDPLSDDPQSKAIMQFTFGGIEESYKEIRRRYPDTNALPLEVYTILSLEQMDQMQEITGGDENRLSYLTKNLGLKLMGLSALLNAGNDVIASISASRKGRRNKKIPHNPKKK